MELTSVWFRAETWLGIRMGLVQLLRQVQMDKVAFQPWTFLFVVVVWKTMWTTSRASEVDHIYIYRCVPNLKFCGKRRIGMMRI